MATAQITDIVRQLRHAVLEAGTARTDGELLNAFVERRDESALVALVERHAPMVWGVCRRLLHEHHDAEDAFQATFLVFVRKAATLQRPEQLANWLYGVAHQTAVRARAVAAKRGARERQVAEMPEPAAVEPDVWADLQPVLDQELSRLPDRYRLVIVLCDLEGKTRKEVAAQLGCPEGTVAGQLARARAMLARRLTRHGLPVSAALLGAVLPTAASAIPPAAVLSSTVQAARLSAAGQAAEISSRAVALSEGVIKAMFLTKLKVSAVVLAAVCVIALGGNSAHRALAVAPAEEKARVPDARPKERAPDGQPKERVPAKDANVVKGSLASVDAEKNTVTITVNMFDRKTGEGAETKKTYSLAKDAKLLQDDVETKLKDLKTGHPTIVKLDGANAVAVTIDGGTMQGQFRTANTERNTITVLAGRNMAKQVFHLLKTTKVLGSDGKAIKLEDLKPGTMVLLTKSVEEDGTVVRIQAMPEK